MLPNERKGRFLQYRLYKNESGATVYELVIPNEICDEIINATVDCLSLEIEILQADKEQREDNYTFYRITVTDQLKSAMLKDMAEMLGGEYDNDSINSN